MFIRTKEFIRFVYKNVAEALLIMELKDKAILVVDDEESFLSLMRRFLEKKGCEVRTEQLADLALDFLKDNHVDLIMADLRMPGGMDGMEFVRAVKEMKYPAEVVVMTGHGTVETAVEAIKMGAFDFMEKPVDFDRLSVIINNALDSGQLKCRIAFLENKIKGYVEFDSVIGVSDRFIETKKLAERIARTEVNLLISGESGCGKEVFARAIHNAGPRGEGPLVAINCGAIAENLLESEMFGHEKGAFTGAVSRRIGHFEHADGGTIFLDEVSELPLSLQVKLLRAVQEKEIMRVGSSRPVKVDCRIISASNKNLEQAVADNLFREDLYYRLNVIELKIPPLRERADDVPLLAAHFVRKHAGEDVKIDRAASEALQNYYWPGNVRELENAIQHAIALMNDPVITADLLPKRVFCSQPKNFAPPETDAFTLKDAQDSVVGDFEKGFIVDALRRNYGNIVKSASDMGITRQTLHKMLKKHDINAKDFKPEN